MPVISLSALVVFRYECRFHKKHSKSSRDGLALFVRRSRFAIEQFETTRSGTLLGLGFATALVGVGAIGLITGTVVFFTAPGDRFATVPPRRARALAFAPTANGFTLSF